MLKPKLFITAVALLSVTVHAQLTERPKLEINGQPVSRDCSMSQSIVKTASTSEQQNAIVLSQDTDTYVDWTIAEGSWFYKSEYTGKTYPTTVKYGPQLFLEDNPSSYKVVKLENDLFGELLFSTDTITGYYGYMYDYDENLNPILPKLTEGNDDGQRIILINDYLIGANTLLSRSYPLSGKARLVANYPLLDDFSSNLDNSTILCNDWLYNAEGKDCTISTDYSLVYYNGEKSAKVKLESGEGVTDVYYIIGNDIFDNKRSQAAGDTEDGYYPITSTLVPEYIAEYKAGETNEAYTVGHVNPSVNEFDIPLPDINGVRKLLIVAYSGNDITDMKYDYIEIRHPEEWKYYDSVKLVSNFTGSMYNNGKSEVAPSILKEATLQMEINNDSTMLRIVNPFICDINSESNHIYINISKGLDKAYIDGSFSPNEDIYYYKEINDELTTVKKRYLVSDLLSAVKLKGCNPEILYEISMDLSNGFANNHSILARCYNVQLMDAIYINNSYSGELNLTLGTALKAETDYKTVTFNTGDGVSYLLLDFGYASSVKRNKVVAVDNGSIRIDVVDGQATLNLNDLYNNNILPAVPVSLNYTAYSEDDKPLRRGIVDISGIDFNSKYYMGNVKFYTTKYTRYFTDKELYFKRVDNEESGLSTVILKEFSSTLTYASNKSEDLSLSFDNSGNCTQDNQIYIKDIAATGYENPLPTYAELDNLTYDNGTILGYIFYEAYNPTNYSDIGWFSYADIEIKLPKELAYNYSGVEDIAIDNDDNSEPVYYNLQGVRLHSPVKGNLVIEVKGDKVRKVIL